MQALLIVTEPRPRKRRPKSNKPSSTVTYRLTPKVKNATAEIAELFGRSENLQVEHGLKIAYLHSRGINIYGMSDLQIIEKFDEMTRHLEVDSEHDQQ